MRVKTYILSCFFVALPVILVSQDLSGLVSYRLSHDWVKKIAAVDYLSESHRQRMAYMFGNRSSYSEQSTLVFSTEATLYYDNQSEAGGGRGFSHSKDEFYIQRNFSEDRTSDVIKFLGRLYLIEDSIQYPSWKILNDMREIAGYICMNAYWEDTVKMQKVVAWFALSLPVSAGPERFGGLPGLILEVNINDGALVISAEEIKLMPVDGKLEKPSFRRLRTIDEASYRELVYRHYQQKRKLEEPAFYGIRY